LTGAGAPGGPGIIKALLKAGYDLTSADCNDRASGRFLHPNFIQIPSAEDKQFIPFLLDYCQQNKIEVILPLVTKELLCFSQNLEDFKRVGVKIIVSETKSLAIANDKGLLYQNLRSKNISVPEFFIINQLDELIDAVKQLGYPEIPVCVKPTVSNGSRGVRILQEVIDEYDLLFSHKPNHLYSTLDKILKTLEERTFPTLLVSEYLPGDEFTVDCLVQKGIAKLILPRSREKMNAGISVQGTFQKHEQIIAYCRDILHSLNLSGPIGLQVKQNRQGVFQLLEINPRLQGTSVAAMGLNINLPALAIELVFKDIDINPDNIAWGTSFVRFYEEAFYK
jgi:carbamoyl-phosphate synthase large subunit